MSNFISSDAEAILSIPLCTRPTYGFWASNFNKKGIFSIKSAYRMLVDTKMRRKAWLDERENSSNSNAEHKSWYHVEDPSTDENQKFPLAHAQIISER